MRMRKLLPGHRVANALVLRVQHLELRRISNLEATSSHLLRDMDLFAEQEARILKVSAKLEEPFRKYKERAMRSVDRPVLRQHVCSWPRDPLSSLVEPCQTLIS